MRHTVAEILFANLEYNLNFIKKVAGNSDIIAIVKANAYGHGIVEISKKLEDLGVKKFGVAYADEGVVLREAGINSNIYVLVPEANSNAKVCVAHNLIPLISSIDFLEHLSTEAEKTGKTIKAHIFIDTGMNREGIRPENAIDFLQQAGKFTNIKITGICTHFATASSNFIFAKQQLEKFNHTLDILKNEGYEFEEIHADNSAAMLLFPESKFTDVRPGLTLYGYPPTVPGDTAFDVKPVMTLKSKVISVRRIKKGDTVGYSMKYISNKEGNIATIPIGYGDGYLRAMTNKAECLINGKRYRTVGTVCMDSCMVDLGDDDIAVGDDVYLLGGPDGSNTVSAYELAALADTIPYEILSSVSARVPRIYFD